MQHRRSWLWGVVLALWALVAEAADCPLSMRITFADGQRACLTEFALLDESPVGWASSVRSALPNHGYYAIAVTPGASQCKRSVGFALVLYAGPQIIANDDRRDRAMRACASRAPPGEPRCACREIVVDGVTSLTRAEFATYAVAPRSAAPGAPTQTAAAAPAAPSPPATAVAGGGPGMDPVRPAAIPASGAPAGGQRTDAPSASAADVAVLRQQIESLQAQVNRQGVAAAPAPAVAALQMPRPRLRARALVIGNSAYAGLGVLANPRNDAEAIAARLRRFGIDVDLAINTSRAGLVKALADYQDRAAGYDVNILFYAGHGLQLGGINYIIPVDLPAAGATVGSIKLNAVSLNDALEYLPARTRVVFLDACRDNPLARSLVAARSTSGIGLAPVTTVSGTLVAYATKDGSTAEDGGGRNSPYTTALLAHMDAEEDIAVVLRRVREAVLKATNSRQEPWEYGSLIGDQLVLSRLAR